MDFKQIETFRSVMQTRSMTVSAASLHTSQPNVSRLIAKLQKELGFRLFQRVGLRLVPTPEGQQLMNMRLPPGTPLPRATEPASLRRTVVERQPVVGELALGNEGRQWAFPIRVPVIREEEVLYVLSAVITPKARQTAISASSRRRT